MKLYPENAEIKKLFKFNLKTCKEIGQNDWYN